MLWNKRNKQKIFEQAHWKEKKDACMHRKWKNVPERTNTAQTNSFVWMREEEGTNNNNIPNENEFVWLCFMLYIFFPSRSVARTLFSFFSLIWLWSNRMHTHTHWQLYAAGAAANVKYVCRNMLFSRFVWILFSCIWCFLSLQMHVHKLSTHICNSYNQADTVLSFALFVFVLLLFFSVHFGFLVVVVYSILLYFSSFNFYVSLWIFRLVCEKKGKTKHYYFFRKKEEETKTFRFFNGISKCTR